MISIMSWHCEHLSRGHFTDYCNKIILYKFLHGRMVLLPDQIAL